MKAALLKLKSGHDESRGEFGGAHHVGPHRQEIAIQAIRRLC
jgi:hypothetical protein